jgi:hypothetical protein
MQCNPVQFHIIMDYSVGVLNLSYYTHPEFFENGSVHDAVVTARLLGRFSRRLPSLDGWIAEIRTRSLVEQINSATMI